MKRRRQRCPRCGRLWLLLGPHVARCRVVRQASRKASSGGQEEVRRLLGPVGGGRVPDDDPADWVLRRREV